MSSRAQLIFPWRTSKRSNIAISTEYFKTPAIKMDLLFDFCAGDLDLVKVIVGRAPSSDKNDNHSVLRMQFCISRESHSSRVILKVFVTCFRRETLQPARNTSISIESSNARSFHARSCNSRGFDDHRMRRKNDDFSQIHLSFWFCSPNVTRATVLSGCSTVNEVWPSWWPLVLM